MAGEWREVRLGDVVEFKRGYDLPSRDRRPGPFPIVSSSGVSGRHAQAKAKAPGVVIGRYGTLGEVHYITEDYWPLNTSLYVRDFKGNDARFIGYFLRNLDFGAYSDKAAVPGLNRNDLHTVEVRLPPITEQQAISHILGTLDDKIDLNRRMIETLESLAQALFKSWFVDFDPVRPKGEGGKSGLAGPLTEMFPNSFERSELGDIPHGWRVRSFGDVVEQLRDQENPLDSPEVQFRHFSIPAFDDGQNAELISGRSIRSVKWRVPPGAVLLSKLNPGIERVWLVDVQRDDRAICSTEFLVLRPCPPHGTPYAYCLARSRLLRQQIAGLATGTSGSHQRAPVDAILRLAVPGAPEPLVRAFDAAAAPILGRSLAGRRESRTLAMVRDSLLPKLILGEVRVQDAERVMASAHY
jgi:type I restriction enzyme S subunit